MLILSKSTIYSVFWSILIYLSSSLLLLFLNIIDFLPLILIILYVGAIAIIFIFVIMLIGNKINPIISQTPPLSLLLSFFFIFLLFFSNTYIYINPSIYIWSFPYIILNLCKSLYIWNGYILLIIAIIILITLVGTLFILKPTQLY